jgi:hypothetical protein
MRKWIQTFIVTILSTLIIGAFNVQFVESSETGEGWSRTYGRSGGEWAFSVVQTEDGGYALAGSDIFLVVKVDASGNEQWSQTYGSGDAYSIVQTSEGDYAIAGTSGNDFLLVKVDASGNEQWTQTYGRLTPSVPAPGDHPSSDQARSMIQTTDGGYAIAGYTDSYGAGGNDFWLVKTDVSGDMQWSQTYGGSGNDQGWSIAQTADGGYILAGFSTSYGDGFFPVGLLIKVDASGKEQWTKTYSGEREVEFYSVIQTRDSGYTLTGQIDRYLSNGGFGWDVLLAKTDSTGNKQWEQMYGQRRDDEGRSVIQTDDGGYVIAGATQTDAGYERQDYGDILLIEVDSSGNEQWNRTYGGDRTDTAFSVIETDDNGYAVAGYTESYGLGVGDFALIKTDSSGSAPGFSSSPSGNIPSYLIAIPIAFAVAVILMIVILKKRRKPAATIK